MTDRDYFTVEGTACTIPHRGAKAIYAGDRPRKNEDGTTSYPLRAPLLLMPPEMFENEDEVIAKVARVLNENAYEFFDSAKKPAPRPSQMTPMALRDAYDAFMEGAQITDDQKAAADRVAIAATFAAAAYEAAGFDRDHATHSMARTFLLALHDPAHEALDYLRADPESGPRHRAKHGTEGRA